MNSEGETYQRPWGNYTTLMQRDNMQLKSIIVHPRQRLSLQLHNHRDEYWTVVQGNGILEIAGQKREVGKGHQVCIRKQQTHRISNTGKENLWLIELQLGEYLGEDDIVRLDDDYGRIEKDS